MYIWNVMTSEGYVVKKPLMKLIKNGEFNKESWIREAEIMRAISHVSTAPGVLAFPC
jgi:hypothetical protein